MKLLYLLTLTAVLLCAPLTANATLLGYPNPNYGTLWDTFSGVTFSNASGNGYNPYMTATLTANNGSGSIINSGTITNDLYYNGNGGMTAATDMTINATATVDMTSIHLYMKFSPPSGTGSSLTTYYTVTLDGIAATQTLLGPTGEVEFGQPLNIVKTSWTGLDIKASDTFTISITEPGAGFGAPGHVALDGIQIVPEPSSIALLLASGSFLAIRRRKYQK